MGGSSRWMKFYGALQLGILNTMVINDLADNPLKRWIISVGHQCYAAAFTFFASAHRFSDTLSLLGRLNHFVWTQ